MLDSPVLEINKINIYLKIINDKILSHSIHKLKILPLNRFFCGNS